MRGQILCLLAVLMLMYAQGEEEEQLEQMMEAAGLGEEEESLQCFRCDLGFWDACYTTETNCSLGERCFTGRGKAVDVLDVKTLGCVKAEECNVETTVELVSKNTVFVMTKHCCDTPFCNAAFKLTADKLSSVTAAFLMSWCVAGISTH
ncbi:sperm acrosome membrane-associated protein 4-like [Phycodurus eques]|uniref:sperm acrosome membrane-associated protein 4-like n=1 Tax=Phycodurus eques TaxID=693459 RepID=UPI002ACED890|nr:sperm acrosome membrane-associated protein 4-like [Phycodurus eques]